MKNFFSKNYFLHFIIILFGFFTLWWISLSPFDPNVLMDQKESWSVFYWTFAALGGIFGIFSSRRFGFLNSVIGRAILALSVGLLLQVIGQILDGYLYAMGNSQIFYPSISEIGYVGSILAYIYGAYSLLRYVSAGSHEKSFIRNVIIWLTPVVMFAISYFAYLHNYESTSISVLQTIFDFGYPLLQSIYVSLAILILLHTKGTEGGVLKKPIIFLVIALIFQYISDSYFVYEYNLDRWYSANLNDYCYFLAYFLLTLAIIYLDKVVQSIQSQNQKSKEVPPDNFTGQLNPEYRALIKAIIQGQEEVIGPLAWTTVSPIKNFLIKDKSTLDFEVAGDPKETINALLAQYAKVFGPIALEVAKRSTERITKHMSRDQIPSRLR